MRPAASTEAALALLVTLLGIMACQAWLYWEAMRLRRLKEIGAHDDASLKLVEARQRWPATIVLLLTIGFLYLCYRYNYWPGFTSHDRPVDPAPAARVAERLPRVAAILARTPAVLMLFVTSICIAGFGYTFGAAMRHLRHARNGATARVLVRAAAMVTLWGIPLVFAFLAGAFWLDIHGIRVFPEPSAGVMLSYIIYFVGVAVPSMIVGSRRKLGAERSRGGAPTPPPPSPSSAP